MKNQVLIGTQNEIQRRMVEIEKEGEMHPGYRAGYLAALRWCRDTVTIEQVKDDYRWANDAIEMGLAK